MDFGSWLQDFITVCQIPIPNVVVLVICMIAFVFVVCLAKMCLGTHAIAIELRKALTILNAFKTVKAEDVETVEEELGRLLTLGPLWAEFRESLVYEAAPSGELLAFNTDQADKYFNFETIVEHKVMIGMYSSVPGFLTSLGLLGTFIALLFAFKDLHVDPSGQVQHIDKLINALSGKFVSSIAGLGLGLMFLFFERLRMGELQGQCLRLQQRLNRLFPMKRPEKILLQVVHHLEEQSKSFKVFNADLSGHLKKSFQESLDPMMKELLAALRDLQVATQELKSQKEESSANALGSMLEEFQKSLTQSTSKEFAELSQVLTQTSSFTEGMNTRMNSFLDHIDSMLESQKTRNNEHLEELGGALSKLIEQFKEVSTDQITTLQKTSQATLQENAEWSQKLAEKLESAANRQLETMDAFSEKLQQSSENAVEKNKHQIGELMSHIAKWNDRSTEKLQDLMNMSSVSAEQLLSLTSGLAEHIKAFKELLDQSETVTNQMHGAGQQISGYSKNLSEVSSQLLTTAERSKDAADSMASQLKQYYENIDSIRALWTRQEELYGVLDNKLGDTIKSTNEALTEYTNTTHDSLAKYLNQFDESLTEACRKLSGTVTDLDDLLSELGEVIERQVRPASVAGK
jgi:ABC-type transporter Mla subunit MlaD